MSKIRASAHGKDCTLRIYPYCTHDPSETVLCHIGCEDKGASIKSPDWWAVYGCRVCHDIIDGRMKVDLPKTEIQKAILRGLYLTHKQLIWQGLVKWDGE